MLRAIVRQGALRGAVASAAGAFAVGTAAWARCDAPPARVQPPPRGPASAAAAAEAEANGDLTARNLDVNIARVEDWKATIERAKAAWSAGERLQAEVELRAALEKASYFGNESPPVATSMHNLAELLRRTGRVAESIPLYERALSLFEKTAGPAHRTTTTCLLALAAIREDGGDVTAAAELYARAATTLREAVAEEPKKSPALAAILVRLGEAHASAGRLGEAERALSEAVRICVARWGAASPRSVQPRLLLAQLAHRMGDSARARAEATAALGASPTDAQRAKLDELLARC
ncbi:hypothetical protein KFE25_005318 [Diacronema lutheri]|uniref:Tetratricopeptide repeat protein n=2 Tax=Diacronema lutheri TaxID=2081491 RepID=A0A8J5XJF3_DIALT|nr:hypothetical protein KFE25_005318 [Diacronema lutheri]